MKTSQPECQKFATRLIEAMMEAGQNSRRKSQTGVTTLTLRDVAGVTNEMARRYTLGQAWPDNEKMAKIARWLGVRQAWLQYGEAPKSPYQINEGGSAYNAMQPMGLDAKQIELLQESLIYVMQLGTQPCEGLDPRQQAKATAVFFNHCLTHNIHPEGIPDDLQAAVLAALSTP